MILLVVNGEIYDLTRSPKPRIWSWSSSCVKQIIILPMLLTNYKLPLLWILSQKLSTIQNIRLFNVGSTTNFTVICCKPPSFQIWYKQHRTSHLQRYDQCFSLVASLHRFDITSEERTSFNSLWTQRLQQTKIRRFKKRTIIYPPPPRSHLILC